MQNGIQNYLVQPDVNRLVGFLKNEDNDEEFKKAVMNKMIIDKGREEEPNDFPGVLARGRQYYADSQNESVFARFDALPLQEQLAIHLQLCFGLSLLIIVIVVSLSLKLDVL